VRVAIAAVSIVTVLAIAAPAWAKEPIRATFCGASGCRTFEDRATLNRIPGGEATTPVGPAAPYYRVEIVNGEEGGATHSFFMYYVPSANAMAWDEPEGVMRYHPIFGSPTINLMRRLTRELEPFPRPVVARAVVGGRHVTGAAAQTYLQLFDALPEAPLAESPNDWVLIDLRSSRPSPWTDGTTDLVFSPSANLLERGWTRVKLPDAVAADVEAARAIAGQERSWLPALAVAPLGVAAVALVLLRGRRWSEFRARRKISPNSAV
jgi:hypothetical protein